MIGRRAMLVTSLSLPEDEPLNRKLIGRGERLKAEIEEGERPRRRFTEAKILRWLAEEYGRMAGVEVRQGTIPQSYRFARKAGRFARRYMEVSRGTVGGGEGEAEGR